jgi:CBS domain-containing protein
MENTDMSNLIDRISSSDIMTPNPTTIISKDKVPSAKGIMVRHRIDHLPVVKKQQRGAPTLVGMITSSHIMQSGMHTYYSCRTEFIYFTCSTLTILQSHLLTLHR